MERKKILEKDILKKNKSIIFSLHLLCRKTSTQILNNSSTNHFTNLVLPTRHFIQSEVFKPNTLFFNQLNIISMRKFEMAAAVILFLFVTISASAQTNYYISPTGDDANAGTSTASPYATLEKARDQIRATNPTEAVTVWLMDGDYYLENTFDLTSQDSGTSANRTTYRAVNKHAAKKKVEKKEILK